MVPRLGGTPMGGRPGRAESGHDGPFHFLGSLRVWLGAMRTPEP